MCGAPLVFPPSLSILFCVHEFLFRQLTGSATDEGTGKMCYSMFSIDLEKTLLTPKLSSDSLYGDSLLYNAGKI